MQRGTAPTEPLLPDGGVHIWLLPRDDAGLATLAARSRSLLGPDERSRLQAFHSADSAQRFLHQRALLRLGLSHHLGVEPADLAFELSANGKPKLKHPASPGIDFNLSHSATEAVLAVARADCVGVDLESLGRAHTARKIAKRFFSQSELRGLRGEGEKPGLQALSLWCLKESIVKAVGKTVWDGLAAVSLEIGDSHLRWLAEPPEGAEKNWSLILGRLRDTHLLATAVKTSSPQAAIPEWRIHTLGVKRAADHEVELLLTSGAPKRRRAPR